MKKIFRCCLPFTAIVVLFSSCLGSSDSKVSVSRDFAYVKNVSTDYGSENQAIMQRGSVVTSEALKNDSDKRNKCFYASYSYKTSQIRNDGVIVTDQLQFGDPIPVSNFEERTVDMTKNEFFKSFQIDYATPFDRIGDNWLFSYVVPAKEDQVVTIDFAYDPERQFDVKNDQGDRPVLDRSSQLIIDIVVTKNAPIEGKRDKDKAEQRVANLAYLREIITSQLPLDYSKLLQETFGDETYAYFPIKFRYNLQEKEDDKDVVNEKVIGTWGDKDNVKPAYYFAIEVN